jgi:hypothetical protein
MQQAPAAAAPASSWATAAIDESVKVPLAGNFFPKVFSRKFSCQFFFQSFSSKYSLVHNLFLSDFLNFFSSSKRFSITFWPLNFSFKSFCLKFFHNFSI